MSRATLAASEAWRRAAAVAPPYLWLLLFFLVPFAIVLKISLADQAMGIPPYTPLYADGAWQATGANYAFLFSDSLYARAYANAIWFAFWATLGCLLIGYPLAYGIVRAPARWRSALLLLVILPFWTSYLIRVYAWIGLLKNNGFINNLLLDLGLIHAPLPLINNAFAVYVGLIYSYLPYMVLPLYASLEKLDPTLLEAAADLGCRPSQAFWRVTVPLSLPGIIAGSLLVFIPMCGEFVIPDLLGGPNTLMIGKVLWDEFFTNRDWPVAAAVAVAMLVVLVLPMALLRRYLAGEPGVSEAMINRLSPVLAAMMVLGFAFLYGPIASVVIYSFNASRLVTVWAGFSTRWYGELWQNEQIKAAALTSLEIAVLSATGALLLGTLAGFVLARYRRFIGRTLFGALVTGPLVMPEVITGLSLLLLFVALEQATGWPRGRGVPTIVIAHVTLGLAYVSVVVEARLAAFDRSLEEAALDLGARPWKVFAVITLPLIAPALVAGWLLAFTLSLDDLVIASFTTGPSATTLPMVIFSSVRLGLSPQINALATILLGVVAVAVLIAGRLVSRFRRSDFGADSVRTSESKAHEPVY